MISVGSLEISLASKTRLPERILSYSSGLASFLFQSEASTAVYYASSDSKTTKQDSGILNSSLVFLNSSIYSSSS